MPDNTGLETRNLTVRYGGSTALDDVSLSAPIGRITGLIGPNGAGKTTLLNTCFGVVTPAAGSVHLRGADITRISTPRRAQAGLGRTFQRMELFESLTVEENVAMGAQASMAGLNIGRQLYLGSKRRRAIADSATEALELCGIARHRSLSVAALSTGQRRLVEFARVLAGPARILLLDEPSSGLDRAESERFGSALLKVVSERELAVLVVEHDMILVSQVCEFLHVLDFGKQLTKGPTAEVMSSDILRDAYLGSSALAAEQHVAESGSRPDASA